MWLGGRSRDWTSSSYHYINLVCAVMSTVLFASAVMSLPDVKPSSYFGKAFAIFGAECFIKLFSSRWAIRWHVLQLITLSCGQSYGTQFFLFLSLMVCRGEDSRSPWCFDAWAIQEVITLISHDGTYFETLVNHCKSSILLRRRWPHIVHHPWRRSCSFH